MPAAAQQHRYAVAHLHHVSILRRPRAVHPTQPNPHVQAEAARCAASKWRPKKVQGWAP